MEPRRFTMENFMIEVLLKSEIKLSHYHLQCLIEVNDPNQVPRNQMYLNESDSSVRSFLNRLMTYTDDLDLSHSLCVAFLPV